MTGSIFQTLHHHLDCKQKAPMWPQEIEERLADLHIRFSQLVIQRPSIAKLGIFLPLVIHQTESECKMSLCKYIMRGSTTRNHTFRFLFLQHLFRFLPQHHLREG